MFLLHSIITVAGSSDVETFEMRFQGRYWFLKGSKLAFIIKIVPMGSSYYGSSVCALVRIFVHGRVRWPSARFVVLQQVL